MNQYAECTYSPWKAHELVKPGHLLSFLRKRCTQSARSSARVSLPPLEGVRLRFSTSSGIISWLIRWRTEGRRSHVEYEFANGWTLGARFSLRGKIGRVLGIAAWCDLDGVQMRPPAANRQQREVRWAVFPGIQQAAAWGYANRLGYPYDLLAILGIVLATGWHSAKKRFCSWFTDETAQLGAGYQFTYADASCITPRDLDILLPDMKGTA